MYIKHHSQDSVDFMSITSEIYFENIVNEHLSLIITNKSNYKLLFFKSQGSSLERFKDEFTDFATKQTKQYIGDVKTKYPKLKIDVPDFFIHISISGILWSLQQKKMNWKV